MLVSGNKLDNSLRFLRGLLTSLGHALFIFTIGRGERLRYLIVWQLKNIMQEIKIRLILIVGQHWLIEIGYKFTKAAGAKVRAGRGI